MTVIGITLDKSGYSYTVLDGDRSNPRLVAFDNIPINNCENTQQLVNWYETTFENLITRFNPAAIGAKVSLNAKKAEIAPWYYPLGLLHNISYRKGIVVHEFVSQNFTPSKFGFSKDVDIYNHVDATFGIQTPKWSKNQKSSVLAGWIIL